MAGSLTISGMSSGEPAGERIFGPLTVVGKAVIGETIVTPMAAGVNTFSVPTESVAVMIVPPLGNEASLKFRTSANATDMGLPICESASPTVIAFPVAGTPVAITIISSAATPNAVSITFI